MRLRDTIIIGSLLLLLSAIIVLIITIPTTPSVNIQPEKPDREYIRKYPVAGGGYQYILVREYELNVEFVEDTTYGVPND